MRFRLNETLQVSESGGLREGKWKVIASQHIERISFVKLRNASVPNPLTWEAVGACVDTYSDGRTPDPFAVMQWVNEFTEACRCMAGNYAGIPEPVDYFTVRCPDPGLPQDTASQWPFIVYYYPPADPVYPLPTGRVRKEEDLFRAVYKLAGSVGHTMKALHQDGIVLRQICLENLRFLGVTRSYLIAECFSMAKTGDSAYDPHRPYLALDEANTAPECFQPDGKVTSATDVYALGRLLLAYLKAPGTPHSEGDVNQLLQKVEERYRVTLRQELVRTFKLALRPNPAERLATAGQFLAMLNGADIKPRSHERQNQTTQPRPRSNPPQRRF